MKITDLKATVGERILRPYGTTLRQQPGRDHGFGTSGCIYRQFPDSRVSYPGGVISLSRANPSSRTAPQKCRRCLGWA